MIDKLTMDNKVNDLIKLKILGNKIALFIGVFLLPIATIGGSMNQAVGSSEPELRTFSPAPQEMGGDFTLEGKKGEATRLSDFRGKVVILYFGYTHCPDVCPTALGRIQSALTLLKHPANVQVLFVTLDPERDTRSALDAYLAFFDPDWLGLRSENPETLADVAKQYQVIYRKESSTSQLGYLVAHSDFIYLIDWRNRPRFVYNSLASPKNISEGVASLLQERLPWWRLWF